MLLAVSLLMMVAFTAIFTLLGMLIQNRTIVAIVSILGVVILFLVSITINQKLNEPEFYEYFSYGAYGEPGEVTTDTDGMEMMPNPNYLQPQQRAVYEFIYDLLPTGQSMQVYNYSAAHPWRMQLCSLSIIVITTACGIYFFRKKDLK